MNNNYVFTPAEVGHLKELVQEVLHIINYDDTGVTDDLVDKAEICAEILGLHQLVVIADDYDTLPE